MANRGTPRGRRLPAGLTAAERRIWHAYLAGEPVQAAAVRGDVLADLLTRPVDRTVHPRPALRLTGAEVTGVLDLSHAEVTAPVLFDACAFTDTPNLDHARLATLVLTACTLPGLRARRLAVTGGFYAHRCTVTGLVALDHARVDGPVELHGTRLHNPGARALSAEQLSSTGFFAHDGFSAAGEVRLVGATVTGNVELSGATLDNPGGRALQAERAEIAGSVFMRYGFVAHGEVRLFGCRIAGGVSLNGAVLRNPGAIAFNGTRLATGSAQFRNGFEATGEVRMPVATVTGPLDFNGSRLANDGGDALVLTGAQLGELWLLFAVKPRGQVRLSGTRIDFLGDHPDTWPDRLRLTGCTYRNVQATIKGARVPVTVAQRLSWVGRDPTGYSPQPYEQLADFYRRSGQDTEARRVLLERHRRRRATLPLPGRLLGYALDALIGYGYRTWLAAVWLAGCWLAGALVLTVTGPPPLRDPSRPSPEYHPLLHAFDLLLPIVDVGQEDAWLPTGFTGYVAGALVVAGWVLTTAVVAGLTRVFSRS